MHLAPRRTLTAALTLLVTLLVVGMLATGVADAALETSTVAAPTTSTPVGGIIGQVPAPPSTIPFTTRRPNAHVSPVFEDLSIGGFAAFVLIAAVQMVLTRPGRRGRRTL